ncbi:MAG TPA: ribosome maturation factor RimM [Ktedonobacteraceae bacterium]|nr:ribosome maturation factor RimM [Ktedonobacteraceae bacterium]
MKDTTEWATIGRIVAPFGIRGELKVFSLSDVPDRFAHLASVYLGRDHTRYRIAGVRPYKGDVLLLKLAGIDDATAAESLRNDELVIPASELAPLPPDSYYQHDIIGLQVITLAGHVVGTIHDIMETGVHDVYVVNSPEGKQVLIPAIKDVVKQVDLIRKVMYIDPMPGLLDDNAVVVDQSDSGID